MPNFRLFEDSIQEAFQNDLTKVQIFGGGFANGKTANVAVKILRIAREYPGANILAARATYPKLNDTLRKEMLKWCPNTWIKKRPTKDANDLVLKNGSTINFRYIAQQGKYKSDASSSNLLSATYDAIVVDQIEDPEIVAKDFDDLNGRLRGMAKYDPPDGNFDPNMPRTGPRWFMITLNPTRSWPYKKLIKPLHDLARGVKNPNLIVNEKGEPLISLHEGSTYENKDNLEPDFIEMLEATYKGVMRDRFLLGLWAAYEGLVYSTYQDEVHQIDYAVALKYFYDLLEQGTYPTIVEGFDYGIAVASCYLLGFRDLFGNVIILKGFYQAEMEIEEIISKITKLRREILPSQAFPDKSLAPVISDPSIFRRISGEKKTKGPSIARMLHDEATRQGARVSFVRGNNDIINGIAKVQTYLHPQRFHRHPVTNELNSPYIYFADDLDFMADEFNNYFWAKDTQTGEPKDKPQDKDDHGMDTTKYIVSKMPTIAKIKPVQAVQVKMPGYLLWHEYEERQDRRRMARSA